jgi:bacterioferritin (cytochrome b1)
MIRLFAKPLVVELPTERKKITPESEASILNLHGNPGFTALMDRIRVQKSVLEATLKNERHPDIRVVDHLQSGIYWLTYLEKYVDRLVHKRLTARAIEMEPEEADEVARIQSAIERIGPQDRK